jgi:hypothetical protein
MKIWAKTNEFFEGKFLVVRRDGSVPHWPHFVLGGRDPAAPYALRAYANEAIRRGYDAAFCESINELANDFEQYCQHQGNGDPDAPPHRRDDPAVIMAMRGHDSEFSVRIDKGNIPKDSTAHLVKTWLPAQYMDECIPTPRPTPDAWIIHRGNHFYLDKPEFIEDARWTLAHGTQVKFNWTAVLGTCTVTMVRNSDDDIVPECSHAIPMPPPGTYLTMWLRGDADTMSDELETLTEGWREGDCEEVEYYVWSEDITFTFDSETGRFLEGAKLESIQAPMPTPLRQAALKAIQEDRLFHHDLIVIGIMTLAAPPDETAWTSYSEYPDPKDGQWFYWRDPNSPGEDHVDPAIVTDGIIDGKNGCGLMYYTLCQPCKFDPEVEQILLSLEQEEF